MNNDQFIRYKALDRCFRQIYGHFTKDDLIAECSRALSDHYCEDRRVAERTIEKDLEDIQLYYDVVFRKGYKDGKKKLYQYENTSFSLMKELLKDEGLEKQMLQNVLDMLSLYADVPQYKWLYLFVQERINGKQCDANIVSFQNNPDLRGLEFFDEIMEAIVRKQTLSIKYRAFGKEFPVEKIIHPYWLKQYNDRWFLLANDEGFSSISNYPLDRLEEVSLSSISYVPAEHSVDEYLEDVVGVSRDLRKPVEDVIIRVSNSRYPYVETKPIHASQKELHGMVDDKTHVIQLRVQVNKELESKILSFGNDMEVLAPEHLRDSIKQKISDLFERYYSK